MASYLVRHQHQIYVSFAVASAAAVLLMIFFVGLRPSAVGGPWARGADLLISGGSHLVGKSSAEGLVDYRHQRRMSLQAKKIPA